MTAPAGSFLAEHNERMLEIINRSMMFTLASLDPHFKSALSSAGVVPVDELGRNWHYIRTFSSGLTGVIEHGQNTNMMQAYGDAINTSNGDRLYLQTIAQTYPDALLSPHQSPYRVIFPITGILTNLPLSLEMLRANASSNVIGDIIVPHFTGFARNIARYYCNAFYSNENGSHRLSDLGDSSASGTTSASWTGAGPYYLTFSPSNGATSRYEVGMAVDIYTADGSSQVNVDGGVRERVFVDIVDHIKNEVRLVTEHDTGDWDGGSNYTSNIVVYEKSKVSSTFYPGMFGLNQFLRTGTSSSTDYILGSQAVTSPTPDTGTSAIDVNVYPEHKSLGFDLNGAPLSETLLRKIMRRTHVALGVYGKTVDTWTMSEGVGLAWEETRIGRQWEDRTGRVGNTSPQGLNTDGDFGGWTFTQDGHTYTMRTSTWIEDGTVYGTKMAGNWRLMSPPPTPGGQRMAQDETGLPFEFIAPALTGTGSNYFPITTTENNNSTSGITANRMTSKVQMPGQCTCTLVPEQFNGVKIVNAAVSKLYGEDDVAPSAY